VTIEAGAQLKDCQLANAIVGVEAQLERADLHDSLVGARARVRGLSGTVNLADDSEVLVD
jgi:hypothetical protein